jgi:hypothetical protein
MAHVSTSGFNFGCLSNRQSNEKGRINRGWATGRPSTSEREAALPHNSWRQSGGQALFPALGRHPEIRTSTVGVGLRWKVNYKSGTG